MGVKAHLYTCMKEHGGTRKGRRRSPHIPVKETAPPQYGIGTGESRRSEGWLLE